MRLPPAVLTALNSGTGPFTPTGPAVLVPATVTSTLLLATDTTRKIVILYNSSTSFAYLDFWESVTVSAWSHKMASGSYWKLDYDLCSCILSCIWTSTNGGMMVKTFIKTP